MAPSAPRSPLLYSPSVERAEADEAETAREIVATMRKILETTHRHYGHAVRSVHAKSHALVEGELIVFDNLPAPLRQGLFERAATLPVVLRFSTNPGDVLPDTISVPRGLGVKVIGVSGARLPGSEGEMTQDFVMANGPAFSASTGKAFLQNLKLLAATTDRMEGTKKALSATLRGAEKVLEAVGAESATLKTLGGQPQTHPLGETYFSQSAFRYGDHIAKFSIAPVSPELTALIGREVDVADKPDGLREAMVEHFRTGGGEWELRVQLCTNLETMPVEDAAVIWPEEESPFVAVGRIRVAPQMAWSEDRSRAVDDGLSFSPWHGLAAHRPLGSLNRMRQSNYEASAAFRAGRNDIAIEEPRAALALGDGGDGRGHRRATSAAAPIGGVITSRRVKARAKKSRSAGRLWTWGGAGIAVALGVGAALWNVRRAQEAERANPPLGRFLTVDGVRLHYLERGEGSPVLLLHGNGSMIEDWLVSGVLDELASRHRVIAFDRPGFGHSERPRSRTWTPAAQAALLGEALDRLNVETPLLVAHSIGTQIALNMALDRPAKVLGLVLIGGYYFPSGRADVLVMAQSAIPVVGNVMRYTVSPLLGAALTPRVLAKLFAPAPVTRAWKEGFPTAMTLRPSQIRAAAAEAAMMIPAAATLSKRYGELTAPVTIIAGAGDEIVDPSRQSRRLQQEVAHSKLTIVEGSGHMVHHSAPHEVTAGVEAMSRQGQQG